MSDFNNNTNSPTVSDKKQKFRELDLSVTADLETFLNSAESVAEDAQEFFNSAEVEHYKSLNSDGVNGEDVFRVVFGKLCLVRNLASEIKQSYIANDKEIPDQKIEEVQSNYNDLVVLRNYISHTYLYPPKSAPTPVPQPAPTPVPPKPPTLNKQSTIQPQKEKIPEEKSVRLELELSKPYIKRKTMEIISDSSEEQLPLHVAQEAERVIVNRLGRPTVGNTANGFVVRDNITRSEKSVVAATESRDPINRAVVNDSPYVDPKKIEITVDSVFDRLIAQGRYHAFISGRYPTSKDFGKVLNHKVSQIEDRTIDSFERWLGEESLSAFRYLKGKTIGDISRLMSRTDVRSILIKRNVKYETFLTWIDLITEIQGLIKVDEDITLLELFARSLIESEMKSKR